MLSTCIGLTGGMGVGKSSVARRFRALQIPVIDADAISHQITAPAQAGTLAVKTHFGPSFLTPDGAMDRKKMRRHLLAHPQARTKLRELLHPIIWEETQKAYQKYRHDAPYVIFDCPLLLEKKEWREAMQRILLIDLPQEQQIQRIAQRSGLDQKTILGMLAWQMPRAQRLAYATDILCNYDDLASLRERVRLLHTFYLSQFQ